MAIIDPERDHFMNFDHALRKSSRTGSILRKTITLPVREVWWCLSVTIRAIRLFRPMLSPDQRQSTLGGDHHDTEVKLGGFLFRTGRHGVRTDLEAKRRLLIQRGERRQDHGGLQIRLLFVDCAAHGTIFLSKWIPSQQEVALGGTVVGIRPNWLRMTSSTTPISRI